MPIALATNVAQGATCLAVVLKINKLKLKEMILPAFLSSLLGITESAIFGVNLRFLKLLIAGYIGSACGAVIALIIGIYATVLCVTRLF